MKPSILIPTYNRPKRLRRALDSIMEQTIPCEVVVVDGGSRYGLSPMLDGTRWDDRHDCRSHQFPAPGPGFLPTWYTATALATGDVCHFQLDDDWIDPTFMERTVAELTDDVSCVLTQSTVHFEDGRPDQQNMDLMPARSGKVPGGVMVSIMMNIPLTITPASATMRRQDVLDFLPVGRIPNAPRRTNCADAYMMLSLFASRPYVYWIADSLAHLGAHADGFTVSRLEGEDRGADLVAQYSEVKTAWMRNR